MGQVGVGPPDLRPSGRRDHAARCMPDGGSPRDGARRPDRQPERPSAGATGPRPGAPARERHVRSVAEEQPPAQPDQERPARSGRSRRKRKSGGGRAAQYWMVVSSPDNFRKTREHNFSIQGLKSRHRRRVETMRVGDRVLYYIPGRMGFAATVTVASPMYEDHTPIWRSARRDEDYPWRVHIRADVVLEDTDWVPAKELAYRLDYVRKWAPQRRAPAVPGHIHPPPRTGLRH